MNIMHNTFSLIVLAKEMIEHKSGIHGEIRYASIRSISKQRFSNVNRHHLLPD